MNWIDLVILLLLLLFAIEGFRKSFLTESLNLLSFLVAFVFSLRFFNIAANIFQRYFDIPHSLGNVLGFTTVWFLVEIILFTIFKLIYPHIALLPKVDKALRPFSVILSFFRGLIFISILLTLVGTFPIQPKVKNAVTHSALGSVILNKTQQLEAPLKSVFGGIAEDSLNFFTIEPETNEKVDLGFTTTDFAPNASLESQMINLVNKERTTRGLPALTYNASLQTVARGHSEDMFKRGYFSHYSPEGKNVADRAAVYNIDYSVIGENLAFAPDLDLAHTGLMNSPGHKANILSPDYHQIGIGIMDSPDYGLMITQVFKN